MNVDDLLHRLESVRRNGGGWVARCAAHQDRNPSLSISEGRNGGIVLRCFAGCETADICRAIGIELRDLMPSANRPCAPKVLDPAPRPWPAFEVPTAAEIKSIAALRNVSVEGVELAAERGLLFCATWRESRCWIVTDATRRNAQARRLDGKPLASREGKPIKAQTLPGARAAWPIGLADTELYESVLLVEGAPDLLAAHHFISIEEREFECAVVAILGASNRPTDDMAALFAGKSVRIFPHTDTPGRTMAARWIKVLLPVARAVDVFDFAELRRTDGTAVKDLNDSCSVHADDFESRRELWSICP